MVGFDAINEVWKGGLMQKVLRWFVVLTLLVALGCAQQEILSPLTIAKGNAAPSPSQAGTQPLFIITCNRNADAVHYDAQITADGTLDPKEPVIIYWVIVAQDGCRKNLNGIQKKMVYGIDIKPDPSVNGFQMTIVAAPQRAITIRKVGSAVRAEIVIDDRPAILERIHIAASDGLFWPTVRYLEIYGKDVQTAENRFEKVIPK